MSLSLSSLLSLLSLMSLMSSARTRAFSLFVLCLTAAVLCSSCSRPYQGQRVVGGATTTTPTLRTTATNERSQQILCADLDDRLCGAACPTSLPRRAHDDCLINLRFVSDPQALTLARAIYEATNVLPGIAAPSVPIEGYRGENVELIPALPLGPEYRHHLAWLRSSFETFRSFLDAIGTEATAQSTVSFDARPDAVIFFRTPSPSYPSAFFIDGNIAYNLDGPRHSDRREMHETLFHELFHVNDAKHDAWSTKALQPIFDAIVERCGVDHECLRPYTPHDSTVSEGTFYAFDERTRHVREYAAELALRYFLEHEPILAGMAPAPSTSPPFKCWTEENRAAWDLLVGEFFGGVDLTSAC
jgi:hypothetical protein